MYKIEILENHYIGKNEVNKHFVDNTKKYLIKSSTGIGGTTAIIEQTSTNYIVVLPTTSAIKVKRKKLKASNRFFIYENSKHKWSDVQAYKSENIIVVTTPNQIIRKKGSKLFNWIVEQPLFIDEIHAYIKAIGYRDEVQPFLDLVFNNWNNECIKLSTATPNYKGIDVFSNQFEYVTLKRKETPRKQLKYSENTKDIDNFASNELYKGNKVLIFSNDIKVYTKFQTSHLTKWLVGNTMHNKLLPKINENYNPFNISIEDAEVIVMSSKYFEGFDVNFDASILIINDSNSDAYTIGVNEAIQCYGRCRNTVNNALFINKKSKNIPQLNELNTLENTIKSNNNFETKIQQTSTFLTLRTQYILSDFKLINKEFKAFNFNIEYYTPEFDLNPLDSLKVPFNQQLINLLETENLEEKYKYIKYSIRSKKRIKKEDINPNQQGKYNTKLATMYLVATLINKYDLQEFRNEIYSVKRLQPYRFYKKLYNYLIINYYYKEYLNVNVNLAEVQQLYKKYNWVQEFIFSKNDYLVDDFIYLYTIYMVENKQYKDDYIKYFQYMDVINNIDNYKKYDVKYQTYKNRTLENIIQELENSTIPYTEAKVKKEVNENIKGYKQKGENHHFRTSKIARLQLCEGIIYLYVNNYRGKINNTKNREYNPLTAVPKVLRGLIPFKLIEVDICSANPQIIDSIYGYGKWENVYTNLMQARNINRSEAKELFNSTLNNHRQTKEKSIQVYTDAGYTINEAKELSKLTAKVEKGSFYNLMTSEERPYIEKMLVSFDFPVYSLHDAVIFRFKDVYKSNNIIPLNINGFKFDVKAFNFEDSRILKKVDSSKVNHKVTVTKDFTNPMYKIPLLTKYE